MSTYEERIMRVLLKEKIKFVREKTYKNLKNGKYRYDFYLPDKNVLIEVDGEFHFQKIGTRQQLLTQQSHDREKNSYALAHHIPLYRIPYWDIKKIKSFSDIINPNNHYLVKSKFHNELLSIEKNIPLV